MTFLPYTLPYLIEFGKKGHQAWGPRSRQALMPRYVRSYSAIQSLVWNTVCNVRPVVVKSGLELGDESC